MNQRVTGLILAGGQSSRMGTDKGLMAYRGTRLVAHAIAILSPLCDELLISTSNPEYQKLGYPTIADHYTASGPGAGIHAALKNAKHDVVAVLSVDTPNIPSIFYSQMLSISHGVDAVIPRHQNGYIEPLCAIYNKSSIDCFDQSLSGGIFKMMSIINQLTIRYFHVSPEASQSNLFHNINTHDDLKQ